MRKFTGQQKAVLAGLGVILAVLTAVLASQAGGRKESQERTSRAVQTIPDAEEPETPQSKREAYREGQRGIDGYWDSLEEETRNADSGTEAASTEERPPMTGGRARALTYEDIVAGTDQPDPGRSGGTSSGRTIRDDPQRQALLKVIAEQEERQRKAEEEASGRQEDEEPEPERMTGIQSQVKRTGAISSLDDDMWDDSPAGFSSLDDSRFISEDEGRPYRCMFSRDEKVKSGQRVSVRLLEDMVVGGTLVPKNTRLSAVCTIGKRMDLLISTIEINNRIHTVGFEGYDTDGAKGIYCSDLVESTRRIRSQGLSTAGSILGGRNMVAIARDAANVGLALAQSASGESTVSIPSGYVFYLVEKRQ